MLNKLIGSLMVLFVMSAGLTGCGTLFTGSSSMFAISSEPEKAKVYVNGMYIGTTPTSTPLKRDKDYNIVVKKEGYEDASAVITRSFNAVAILNLLSPICWIVDIVTGGMWKFDRDGVTVDLDPVSKKAHVPTIIPGKGFKMKVLDNGKTVVYQP
jgi:hypothetical protein